MFNLSPNIALTNIIICLFFIIFFVFSNLNLPLALIALLFIWLKLQKKSAIPEFPTINIFIFLFFISILISTITSHNTGASLRVIMHIIPGIMLYLLLAEEFDIKKINYLFNTFTFISIVISIILLFNYWQYPFKNVRELVKVSNLLFMFTPNDSVILTFFSFFSFYIITSKTENYIKFFSALGIILTLITVVVYQSRLSILIYLIFCFLYFIVVKKNKWLFSLILIVLFSILLLVDMLNHFTLYNKFVSLETFQHRYHLWLAAWDIFLQHPVLGAGPGSFIYLYQTILENYGYIEFNNQKTPWPHGVFIELLAEQGVIGFILFISIILQNLITMFQFNSVVDQDHKYHRLNKFLIIINVCYLFCLLFELTLHRTWVSFFLFTLLGLSQLNKINNRNNNSEGIQI